MENIILDFLDNYNFKITELSLCNHLHCELYILNIDYLKMIDEVVNMEFKFRISELQFNTYFLKPNYFLYQYIFSKQILNSIQTYLFCCI